MQGFPLPHRARLGTEVGCIVLRSHYLDDGLAEFIDALLDCPVHQRHLSRDFLRGEAVVVDSILDCLCEFDFRYHICKV